MREGEATMTRTVRRAATTIMAATLAMLFAAPAFAQGLATVEPTLEECRAFVEENGVPETRPVWENRGYSGWDVCLNMAYDGDLDGYFAVGDANGDGRLDASEQRAYMDSVIGPVSDPDQSPLTLDKCAAMISEYGIPAERPFVDWSNRGYGEVEICQSLAFDGNLEATFASADANSDGRLDRAEQSSYVASVSRNPEGAALESSEESPRSLAQDESLVNEQYGTNAAEERNGNTGNANTGNANTGNANTGSADTGDAVETTEPTISAPAPTEPEVTSQTSSTTESGETSPSDEPATGVLSAVADAVEGLLPDTGGVAILGVLGGAALIIGGFLAYRLFR